MKFLLHLRECIYMTMLCTFEVFADFYVLYAIGQAVALRSSWQFHIRTGNQVRPCRKSPNVAVSIAEYRDTQSVGVKVDGEGEIPAEAA